MKPEGFGIDFDFFSGLPKSKNAWPIWLGDHYTKGNLTVMQIVEMLMRKLKEEMHKSDDAVATYKTYVDVWDTFVEGAEFGDPMLFRTHVSRAVPELEKALQYSEE